MIDTRALPRNNAPKSRQQNNPHMRKISVICFSPHLSRRAYWIKRKSYLLFFFLVPTFLLFFFIQNRNTGKELRVGIERPSWKISHRMDEITYEFYSFFIKIYRYKFPPTQIILKELFSATVLFPSMYLWLTTLNSLIAVQPINNKRKRIHGKTKISKMLNKTKGK